MLRHRLLSLFNAIWAIPAVIIIRLLRPWRLIRIGQLFSGRIGHFVPDALEHFLRREVAPVRTLDYFYFFGGISNSQWANMVTRNLNVKGNWLQYIWHWNEFIPGGKVHSLPQTFTQSRDIEGLLEQSKKRFDFMETENGICEQWLISKGWKKGEPFICLQVRDSFYLAEFDIANPNDSLQIAHSYRDSDIKTYIAAIEWLTSQGYWVIRMGKIAKERLPVLDVKVIDYAFDDSKTDLLDIWLFANCTMCISTSTGPDWISIAYGKPVLFLNALPLGGLFSFARSMWIPKNLVWKSSGTELSLVEMLETTGFQTKDYESQGIAIQDLSPAEILLGVQEFCELMHDSQEIDYKNQSEQNTFWIHFSNWSRFSEFHKYMHAQSFVSRYWLKSRKREFYE